LVSGLVGRVDNGAYVMMMCIVPSVPVVWPVTVPFIVKETTPDTGELNNLATCQPQLASDNPLYHGAAAPSDLSRAASVLHHVPA
jgi:hypothetical protein